MVTTDNTTLQRKRQSDSSCDSDKKLDASVFFIYILIVFPDIYDDYSSLISEHKSVLKIEGPRSHSNCF